MANNVINSIHVESKNYIVKRAFKKRIYLTSRADSNQFITLNIQLVTKYYINHFFAVFRDDNTSGHKKIS